MSSGQRRLLAALVISEPEGAEARRQALPCPLTRGAGRAFQGTSVIKAGTV